jgi:hypothetical protein
VQQLATLGSYIIIAALVVAPTKMDVTLVLKYQSKKELFDW